MNTNQSSCTKHRDSFSTPRDGSSVHRDGLQPRALFSTFHLTRNQLLKLVANCATITANSGLQSVFPPTLFSGNRMLTGAVVLPQPRQDSCFFLGTHTDVSPRSLVSCHLLAEFLQVAQSASIPPPEAILTQQVLE